MLDLQYISLLVGWQMEGHVACKKYNSLTRNNYKWPVKQKLVATASIAVLITSVNNDAATVCITRSSDDSKKLCNTMVSFF